MFHPIFCRAKCNKIPESAVRISGFESGDGKLDVVLLRVVADSIAITMRGTEAHLDVVLGGYLKNI